LTAMHFCRAMISVIGKKQKKGAEDK
jgi:hypothetical protein